MGGAGHNAGRTDLGDKTSDEIAYDFIIKVENGLVSNAPTITQTPTSAPTMSPTSDISECQDDPDWHGKLNKEHTCAFVSQSPGKRCNWRNSDGIRASEACPYSCGTCPTLSETLSPTLNITECQDDPDWHGKFSQEHTCAFVSQYPGDRCDWENLDGILATDACPVSCGTCPSLSETMSPTSEISECQDDPDWHGKFSQENTCAFVSQSPGKRCNWENLDGTLAKQACPVSCDTCDL